MKGYTVAMKESMPKPRENPEAFSQEMRLSQDYFELQVEYAFQVQRITHGSFEDVVAHYTNIMTVMYSGGETPAESFASVEAFRASCQPFIESKDVSHITRLIYDHSERVVRLHEKKEHPFGCFSYGRTLITEPNSTLTSPGDEVRIHFTNLDNRAGGPLSSNKIDTRKRELCLMIKAIRKDNPDTDLTVTGHSWLYNLSRYRELFPKEYQESIAPEDPENPYSKLTNYSGLWLQFVKSDGSVNKPLAEEFLRKARAAATMEELLKAFPLKALEARAPISAFYAMVEEYEREHPRELK